MDAKHTPGPWMRTAISASGTVNVILAASSRTESNVIARDILPHNADLIAAAPDLLAALRHVVECYNDGRLPDVEWLAVRAAIVRAEGR